jgi:ribosomal-protein-alanine N-acetyltransferase
MVTIRMMRLDDLAGVAAIEGETLSSWSIVSLEQEMGVSQGIQLVAEESDSLVVGWCGCRVIWPEAELLKIAVKPRCRARGIAGNLIACLEEKLQRKEVTSLFLEVRSGNRAAVSFYKKTGFTQVGFRPAYYTDPSDSALILKKTIDCKERTSR